MTTTMSVQIRKCLLRNQPSYLGKPVTELAYGDQVTVTEKKGSWNRVQAAKESREGWIHISALTVKEIVLKPNSRDITSGPSNEEIALAGKGFNQQVEEQFKQNNINIDFSRIDIMEEIVVSQKDKQIFLIEGELVGQEGAVS